MKLIAALSALALLVLECMQPVLAEDKFEPTVYTKEFQPVQDIFYFDDSPVILLIDAEAAYQSSDNGISWKALELADKDGKKLRPSRISHIQLDNTLGFVFTQSARQFYTVDQGKTWAHFDLPEKVGELVDADVSVNFENHDRILIRVKNCVDSDDDFLGTTCANDYFVSQDRMKTPPTKVDIQGLNHCTFARNNKDFHVANTDLIVCVRREYDTFGFVQSSQLVASKDFFNSVLVSSEAMKNADVRNVAVVKSFMVATVQVDRYGSSGLEDLYVSKDGINFKKSFFEQQLRSSEYVVLPSTKNSLHVAILGHWADGSLTPPSADVYRSDSQGLYFKKIISGVRSSLFRTALIEKIEGIDGAWIAATQYQVKNKEWPRSRSQITLDDGVSWAPLKAVDDKDCDAAKNCSVNLLWFSEQAGSGEAVTGPTPGILVGVGNTGEYLEEGADKLKTYVSRDGGLSWRKVLDEASLFSFTDFGNIIVAMPLNLRSLNSHTDTFHFSIDQGTTWQEMKLKDSIMPAFLVTAKDGTSHQIMMAGYKDDLEAFVAVTVDFSNAADHKCGKNDMEEWYARKPDADKEAVCVYGHREKYMRRKATAKCFSSEVYKDIEVIEEPCTCTVEDTECELGFRRNEERECVAISSVMAGDFCKGKNKNKKIKLTSRRMILGDPCKGGFKIPKNDYVVDCEKMNEAAEHDKIDVHTTELRTHVAYYVYLDRDANSTEVSDETVVIVTGDKNALVSYDGGSTLTTPMILGHANHEVEGVVTNPYFPNDVYVLSSSGTVYFSKNRAASFDRFTSPYGDDGTRYDISFSKTNSSRFIWFSQSDCDPLTGLCGRSRAAITNDNGATFDHMVDNVGRCFFADSVFDAQHYDVDENLILCERKRSGKFWYDLVCSTDNFASKPDVILEKVIGSTSSGEFLVAAQLADDNSLIAYVTVDGHSFAKAQFPRDIQMTRQTAYTILNVNSKQIFMHVTTSSEPGQEYGSLLKGNYNGTQYVTSIRGVNRNAQAFVDFESVQSLEGISLLNVVENAEQVGKQGKRLKTYISHDDGASWGTLEPPAMNSDGKKYRCKGKECTLNLHSYTERLDPSRDTFSSGSALGMLFGLGNVGEYLLAEDDESTALFFTSDAGLTWKEVRKGQYMWEFGDQGTILVIANSAEKTNVISYSLDQGETWKDYQFATDKYTVEDLVTVPSDTARRFMLVASDDTGASTLITLDFSRIYGRQCIVDLDSRYGSSDFEYWTPRHPGQRGNCLFGRETQYLRRNSRVTDCFIGMAPLSKGHKFVRNCTCTRQDYECDYNFEMAKDGTCKLIPGLAAPDSSEICHRDDHVFEYWEPTGYRKIPLSSCDGGLDLDHWTSHPCPGKQSDYDRTHSHRIHGFALFLVIALPLTVFLLSLIFVYDRGIRRNGGFQRFGEIHLDDDDNLHLIEENTTDKIVNKIVMAGVHGFGLIMAAVKAVTSFVRRRGLGVRSDGLDGGVSSFFNDRIVDNDEDSLFRYADDDDDAREIDSFLDHGIETDVAEDDDDADFGDLEAGPGH